ncbi:hypothetical protein ACROYT_G014198 [Oculina patagonica]
MKWPGEDTVILKKGAKVMLVCNKTDTLKNGTMSVFVEMNENGNALVRIEKEGTVKIGKKTLANINERLSQCAMPDLIFVFSYSVRSASHMQMLNFKPNQLLKQPKEAIDMCSTALGEPLSDLSCCWHKKMNKEFFSVADRLNTMILDSIDDFACPAEQLKENVSSYYEIPDLAKDPDAINQLYEEVVQHYLNMGAAQYLPDFRRAHNLKKSAELRKHVLQRQKKQKEQSDSVPHKAVRVNTCIPEPLLVDDSYTISVQTIRSADNGEQRIVLWFRNMPAAAD